MESTKWLGKFGLEQLRGQCGDCDGCRPGESGYWWISYPKLHRPSFTKPLWFTRDIVEETSGGLRALQYDDMA